MIVTEKCIKIEGMLKNGFIEDYEFYASATLQCSIKTYKGIRITYMGIVPENQVYYGPKMTM
tara:strand:+ start:21 stop:206 length:186 start_codon:yes stop_codon:yes gene_type:complete